MKSYVVVIPARLASTRLPNKPLIDIAGKSLIERTWIQVTKAVDKKKVYVLTDDELIFTHCEEKGIQVVMTSANCPTGTDRVAEFAMNNYYDYYVNVQGDEPVINPEDIKDIIFELQKSSDEIINGYAKIFSEEEFRSVNIPKVVFNTKKELMYMSRSPIPGNKSNKFIEAHKQVCVYAYSHESLRSFSNTNSKTHLENVEDIEILRFIEQGFKVKMLQLSGDSIAVDVPRDIEKVINRLKGQ